MQHTRYCHHDRLAPIDVAACILDHVFAGNPCPRLPGVDAVITLKLAEIRNGTGFERNARFVPLEDVQLLVATLDFFARGYPSNRTLAEYQSIVQETAKAALGKTQP